MISKIKKRDGRIVNFEQEKITNAIHKAFLATKEKDGDKAKKLSNQVVKILEGKFKEEIPSVEDIQDIVEEVLIKNGYSKVAKAYILYRQKRAEIRETKEFFGIKDDLKLGINAIKLLKKRYLLRNEEGKIIETPKQMFKRVAKAVAKVEKKYKKDPKKAEKEFYEAMANLEFLPNSPTLMNAGTSLGQLSACYVLPVGDSLKEIFDAVKAMALVHQSGGGTGFTFSHLRPKGDIVRSTKGVASGPVSFMRVFDVATDVIKQGGCISTSSLVRTDKGIIPIGMLLDCPTFGNCQTRYLVYTNGKFENAFLAEDNNISEVYKIKTEIGTEIKATYNHLIGVINENGEFSWKRAEDIQKGDWIIHVLGGHIGTDIELPSIKLKKHFNSKEVKLPKKMTPELAELLGIYMADGCLSTGGRIIFSVETKDIELKERICKLMLKIFGVSKHRIEKKENENSICLVFYSKVICDYFDKMEWKKKNALNAFVPLHIFQSSRKSAFAFLRGLFEGDGDVHPDGYPRLYSVSERLIKEVQQLLFGLEIVSKYHKYKTKNRYGKNPVYTLSIIQERSIDEFIKNIGFISKRKNEKLINRYKIRKFEQNDIIPNQSKLLREIYNGPGRGCGKNRSKRGANIELYREIQHYISGINKTSQRNLTRKKLKKLLAKFKELRNKQLLKIVSDEYFYSPVSEISVEKDYTMEITVPTAEYFVANSILVHNRRRGANMGILNVDHPDIIEFITAKSKENVFSNFNISVAVTDKFMEAVKKNKKWDLINPRTGEKEKTMKAKEIFDLIVINAWKTGDPGLIFMDEINRHNPTPELGKIEATNPCVSSDTWVMTSKGPRQVKDLIGNETEVIVNGEKWHNAGNGFFCTGVKPVFNLKTKEGFELSLTENHLIKTANKITRYKINTEWKRIDELKPGDKILLNNHQNLEWDGKFGEKEGYLIGFLIGDGVIGKEKIILDSWGETPGYLKKIVKELKITKKKEITPEIEKTSSAFYKGFLKGFFDADGSVQGTQEKGVSIRLAQSNLQRLKAVQRMLLRLGIVSKIYENRRKPERRKLPNGKGGYKLYKIKAQHELVISNENILIFEKRIGFGNSDKANKLKKIIRAYKRKLNKERFIATVKEIKSIGTKEVYDIQIPGINAFDANGFYVHNCGEVPLLPHESCNLGSINLSKMVEDGKINWDKLRKIVRLGVHFLDNVIDANKYPLPEIEKMTKTNRKIGLGVMGFAEMLIKLGIPYDSEKAVKLAKRVMKFISEEARKKSIELGKERGNFPSFKKSIWAKKFKYLRNATVTTIAPTGSISIIAGTTSGIEPLFAISFVRNVLGGERLIETNPEFERVAKERGFYSKELMMKIAKTGSIQEFKEIPKDVKKVFVTALDIKPEWHVKMQAAFQKYTDNAVSKTVNLPEDATPEDVKKIFWLAYKLKCKGITIYRYGSKSEQVLSFGSHLEKDYLTAESEYAGGCPRKEICNI